jgi:hypothetical protein
MTRKRTRPGDFERELIAAKKSVETTPTSLPTCAVPSNALLYAFLRYVMVRGM